MDQFLQNLTNSIFGGLSIILPFLQLVSLIISIVLLWYIFFYIKNLNVVKMSIEKNLDKYGAAGDVGKRRLRKSWIKIEKLIGSKNIEKAKEAITEADKILIELVKMKGVPGKTVNERMDNLLNYEVEDTGEIKSARSIAKRLADKEIIELTHKDCEELVEVYKKALMKISRMSF